MPHVEIKHSADLALNPQALFKLVEYVINRHDADAGECKGRAYPAKAFQHTHVLFEISMLTKPHRDEAFTRKLMVELEQQLKAQIPQTCRFSLALNYSGPYYSTNLHEVG